jgi:hypothetical protein
MSFKRMILEQSDDNYHNEEYIPSRGEAFTQGFSGGLVSAGKIALVLTICILLYVIIAC